MKCGRHGWAAAAQRKLMAGRSSVIPRTLWMLALPLLLLSAACANTTVPPPSSADSSATADRPRVSCPSITRDQGLSLYEAWADVVTSKGRSDHQRRVEEFADEAETLANAQREDACGDLSVRVVQLSSEAARLVAWMLIGEGEADSSKYQAVADAGNSLMSELGVDRRFDTPGLDGT